MTSGNETLRQDLVGVHVGNYVIRKMLGKGGMGEVYLAVHPEIGRQVAVKVLGAHLLQNQMATERFVAEARLLTRLEHPNIVGVLDFGRLSDRRLYYAMEFLKGVPLSAVMAARGKLDAYELAPYVEQICAGLQVAHQSGVIHRDLKPENIFVLDSGELALKLLDFGIAKLLEPQPSGGLLTATGMVIGSPVTMAPEQAAGTPSKIGPHTDIYSLGALLYWMLCGRPVFAGDGPGNILAQQIFATPEPLAEREPSVPPAVAALIDGCLNKQPEDRPVSARALSDEYLAAVKATGDAKTLPALPSLPPIAPAATGAAGDRKTKDETTMRGAAGQVETDQITRPSARKLISLGAFGLVLIAVAMAAIVLIVGKHWSARRDASPMAVATASEPPTAATTAQAAGDVGAARYALSRLNESPSTVTVRFELSPRHARVLLDGEPCAENPVALLRSTSAPHRVRVEAAGYTPQERQLIANADQTLSLTLKADGGRRHHEPRSAATQAKSLRRPKAARDDQRSPATRTPPKPGESLERFDEL